MFENYKKNKRIILYKVYPKAHFVQYNKHRKCIFSLIDTSKRTFFVVFKHVDKLYLPTYKTLFGTSKIFFFYRAIMRHFCDTLFKRRFFFFSQCTEKLYGEFQKRMMLNSRVEFKIYKRRSLANLSTSTN